MDTSDPSLPEVLGDRYAKRGVLSIGSMGEVYEAWDRRLNRAVAIKVVEDPDDLPRFRTEIEILSRLRHPAILPLYEAGEGAGFVYFVMPLVRSSTLRSLLKQQGPLDPPTSLGILADLAGALDHAHAQGIVHGDVKPSNVLIESGRGVLADFGVARAMGWAGSPERDLPGTLGTLPYMSPEHLSDPGDVGPASDIYGLACLAYEMLTGERPFQAGNAAAVAALKLWDARGVGAALGGLPRRARRALLKGLDPKPARRPPKASAFVDGIATGFGPGRVGGLGWGAGVVVAASLVWGLFFRSAGAVGERVVVGPIQDRTGDVRFASLPVSAVDYLTRQLQNSEFVSVVPTETAVAAARWTSDRGANVRASDPIRVMAEETGASIVASGEIFVEDGRLGLSLRITDARRGILISAPNPVYTDLDTLDVGLLLQTGAASFLGSLAAELDDRIGDLGLADPPSFDAYRAFSEGLDRYLAGAYGAAVDRFEDALATDSSFVAPLLYAALSRSNMGQFALEDSLLGVASRRADGLTEPERRWIEYRVALLDGNRTGALRAIRAAARGSPGSKAVYNLGVESMEGRRLQDAVEALRSLPANVGPMRGNVNHLGALALCQHLLGDQREALRTARLARTLFPEHLRPRQWELAAMAAGGDVDAVLDGIEIVSSLQGEPGGWSSRDVVAGVARELSAHGQGAAAEAAWTLALRLSQPPVATEPLGPRALLTAGEAYLALSRLDEARDVAELLAQQEVVGLPGLDIQALRGRVAALTGRTAEAEVILAELESNREPYTFGLHLRAAAMIATALGDHSRATEYLRRGFGYGLPYGEWAHNHPAFQELWASDEYRALMRPIR